MLTYFAPGSCFIPLCMMTLALGGNSICFYSLITDVKIISIFLLKKIIQDSTFVSHKSQFRLQKQNVNFKRGQPNKK